MGEAVVFDDSWDVAVVVVVAAVVELLIVIVDDVQYAVVIALVAFADGDFGGQVALFVGYFAVVP